MGWINHGDVSVSVMTGVEMLYYMYRTPVPNSSIEDRRHNFAPRARCPIELFGSVKEAREEVHEKVK